VSNPPFEKSVRSRFVRPKVHSARPPCSKTKMSGSRIRSSQVVRTKLVFSFSHRPLALKCGKRNAIKQFTLDILEYFYKVPTAIARRKFCLNFFRAFRRSPQRRATISFLVCKYGKVRILFPLCSPRKVETFQFWNRNLNDLFPRVQEWL
jgi:hypothetical protein